MVQITMPSGMSVTAKYSKFRHRRKDSYLNIVVYPLAEDFEHSEGLCGNFNEDKDDDRVPKGSDGDDDRKEPVDFIKSYMSVNRFLRLFTWFSYSFIHLIVHPYIHSFVHSFLLSLIN